MERHRLELLGWAGAALALAALAIPWFLWGSATVVAGLPLWLWWHVGWMLLAALAFRVFATRAWGIGIEPERHRSAGAGGDGTDDGGSRGERP